MNKYITQDTMKAINISNTQDRIHENIQDLDQFITHDQVSSAYWKQFQL